MIKFQVSRGVTFFIFDNNELKRSPKIFFFLFPNGIAGRVNMTDKMVDIEK